MARKGVFAEKLDDIDYLMPQRPTTPTSEEVTATVQATRTVDEEPAAVGAGDEGPESSDALVADESARPQRRRVTTSVPTAEVAPQIHRLLRRLTTKERMGLTVPALILSTLRLAVPQVVTTGRLQPA